MKSLIMSLLAVSIVFVAGLSLTVSATDPNIPEWIKNNAKWWSEGLINETEYLQSLEYLINNGMINVPIPITDVTAAQTKYSDEERAQSFRVMISNIIQPLPVHFFEKFAFANVDFADPNDPRGRIYDFRETNPQFYLESVPSVDKAPFYDFVSDWMDRGDLLNEFDLAVDVLDGTGAVIQTWDFQKCEITGYGTYLHDTTFVYSYSGLPDSEIRDRANFSCVGVSLKTP
ncbi:MAG: hypothetical protein ACW9XH_05085 [Candidatus Nitrosopumilus sp. bin_32a]